MNISKHMISIGVLMCLCIGSVALADIMVGQSNTSLSNDVAYSLVTLDKPSDTANGDVLVVNVSLNGGSAGTITAPAGWTLIARSDNDPNISIASYYKTAAVSEPPSYTWIISPQTRAVGGITRYSGVSGSSPIDVVATSTGRGTTAIAPSIATTNPNERVLVVLATNTGTNNSPFFSTSTGMTKRYNIKNTPFGPTAALEDFSQAGAGMTGSASSSFSNSQRDWAAQTIALRAPAGLQNNLAGYWKLDETSGNAFSAFGTPAALFNTGSALYGSAVSNNGVITNGSTNYLSADATGSSVVLSNTDFSINAWVNFAASTPFGFGIYGDNGSVRSYLFNGGGAYSALSLTMENIGSVGVPWSPSENIWYMVSVTYNKTTGATTFYVNGTQQGTTQTTATNYPNGAGGPFSIGTWDPSDNGALFNGTTDEVGIWKRELSPTEIGQLYDGGVGLSYPF